MPKISLQKTMRHLKSPSRFHLLSGNAQQGVHMFLLGLGVASVIGSRAPTIAILFAWVLIVEPLLTHITALGAARDALLSAADWKLAPTGLIGDKLRVSMQLGVSLGVIAVWALVSLVVGLRRTQTRNA